MPAAFIPILRTQDIHQRQHNISTKEYNKICNPMTREPLVSTPVPTIYPQIFYSTVKPVSVTNLAGGKYGLHMNTGNTG